jgi:hypothetical protein
MVILEIDATDNSTYQMVNFGGNRVKFLAVNPLQ